MSRVRRERDEAVMLLHRAHAANEALAKEVVRLRDLLGDAEWAGQAGACPWCGQTPGPQNATRPHHRDCPAFAKFATYEEYEAAGP